MRIELLAACVAAMVAARAEFSGGGRGTTVLSVTEELFPLTQVRLTGGPLQAQQEQTRKYLLRLEPDRLLCRFRSEAGLKPKAKHYSGWEAPAVPSGPSTRLPRKSAHLGCLR